MGTRSWAIVSRSRMVTAWSSRVSKSTVTHMGRAYLVLAAVAAAYALGVVVLDEAVDGAGAPHKVMDLAGCGGEALVAAEREDGDLDGGKRGVKLEDHAGLRLAPGADGLLLGVGVH